MSGFKKVLFQRKVDLKRAALFHLHSGSLLCIALATQGLNGFKFEMGDFKPLFFDESILKPCSP